MIDKLTARVSAWQRKRQRDAVLAGLLTSVYAQAKSASMEVSLGERRENETQEEYAVRCLTFEHGQMKAAHIVIALMVKNELAARGLLHLLGDDAPMRKQADDTTTTIKRTVVEEPE